jgi:protease II
VNMRGGHSGGSGRYDTLEDFARAYAYGLTVVGSQASRLEASR